MPDKREINYCSHKRCSSCLESKPLDIIHFRYKKTEKRWVAKCRECERKIRNKANAKKRCNEQKRIITQKDFYIKILGNLESNQVLNLSRLFEQSLMEIQTNEKDQRS